MLEQIFPVRTEILLIRALLNIYTNKIVYDEIIPISVTLSICPSVRLCTDCLSANQIKEFVPYFNQYGIIPCHRLLNCCKRYCRRQKVIDASITFSDQQTFAINMKFISVKTVIDHKISSINAKAMNEKSSSTISCLICLQPKVLPFPLVYWVVNLTLTDNIVPKIYRELSALGTLDLES